MFSVLLPPSLLHPHSQWNENLFFSFIYLLKWVETEKKKMKMMLKTHTCTTCALNSKSSEAIEKRFTRNRSEMLLFTETQFCHYLFHQCTFAKMCQTLLVLTCFVIEGQSSVYHKWNDVFH